MIFRVWSKHCTIFGFLPIVFFLMLIQHTFSTPQPQIDKIIELPFSIWSSSVVLGHPCYSWVNYNKPVEICLHLVDEPKNKNLVLKW